MKSARPAHHRWTLADLFDFEAALAAASDASIAADRALFARDIAPRLQGLDERTRRRQGLWLWLGLARERGGVSAGAFWLRGLSWLRRALFFGMAAAGFALVAGLCVRAQQSVHVIVFFVLALLLPWATFALVALVRLALRRRPAGLQAGVRVILCLAARGQGARRSAALDELRQRVCDSRPPRRALTAAFGGVLQWGGLGYALGLGLALLGCLMVFDLRFYWESTPRDDALMAASTQAIAAPWQWLWPAAVPDARDIEASRARYVDGRKRMPDSASAAASWWRFLLMAIVVWGLLPRLLLLGVFRLRARRALARLDFQSPRHRALWRGLTAVERGAVAPAAADAALLLDVGGSGVRAADLRGFLLRVLRVNPRAEHRVSVLDDAAEAAADAALAAAPEHVVLLVEDWNLSPREIGALHARVRAAVGHAARMTWLVLGVRDGAPAVPDDAQLARWTRFVDALRDPGADIVGYRAGV